MNDHKVQSQGKNKTIDDIGLGIAFYSNVKCKNKIETKNPTGFDNCMHKL